MSIVGQVMADWSSLLPELLRQISDKLVAIEDLEAFTSVCKSFRSAAPKEQWRLHPTGTIYRPPWLLLCCQEDEVPIPINKEKSLLSMYKKKRFRMNLPELHGRRCWGSAYGWIVTLGLFKCSNFDGPDPPQVANYIPGDQCFSDTKKYYLIESLGDLLLVVRSGRNEFDDQQRATIYCFDVFKLDSENKKWVRIHHLGDRALFVGNCQSIALESPVEVHCQANCIYFNDDTYQQFGNAISRHDMGVYDYNAKCFHPFYERADSLSYYSTPTWFIPSF